MSGAPGPGAGLLAAAEVMDRLRSPGGCPWDAAQTHASLAPYLVEETYETLDAIESGDPAALREELGDVLLQVLFHARVAAETPVADGGFDIDDVAADLVAKLIGRHPHVFGAAGAGGAVAPDVAAVEASWEQLKQAEKQRTSVTEGIASGQPALGWAAALRRRAGRTATASAVPAPLPTDEASRIGAALFALVGEAVAAGVDPESALRATAREYRTSLLAAERAQRRVASES